MAKKNEKVVVNAPSPEQILKEMEQNAPVITSKDENKEINDLLSGYSEKIQVDEGAAMDYEVSKQPKGKRGRPKKEEPLQTGQPTQIEGEALISGAVMLMLIDLALPNLISFANNKFNKKGKKIKASDLQMSEEQRRELEPVADQVAKEMMLKASPLSVLIISMIGIYGINFMMLKANE